MDKATLPNKHLGFKWRALDRLKSIQVGQKVLIRVARLSRRRALSENYSRADRLKRKHVSLGVFQTRPKEISAGSLEGALDSRARAS